MTAAIRYCLIGVLMGLLGNVLAAGHAAAQFTTQPAVLRVTPQPDSFAVAVVRIQNLSAESRHFRFYFEDFEQSDAGDHQLSPAGQNPRSCAHRVSVFPDQVSLSPNEIYDVRVRLEYAPDSCWSLLFSETLGQDQKGVRVGQRIGAKVYGISPFGQREGEITSVRASVDRNTIRTELEFLNSGDVPLAPEGKIEFRTLEGEVLRSVDVHEFSVLPGRRRRLTIETPTSGLHGRLLAVPVLEFGGDYLAGGQAQLQIP